MLSACGWVRPGTPFVHVCKEHHMQKCKGKKTAR